jgi:hypothetical protein
MQRDYILRMIEQMALVIARIRKLFLGGDVEAARAELRAEAARQGVDLPLARALDPESLLLLLSPTGVPEPGRCWVFAEMLYLDGLQSAAQGDTDDAVRAYGNALRLFLALDPSVIGGIPEASARIAELEQRIDALLADA